MSERNNELGNLLGFVKSIISIIRKDIPFITLITYFTDLDNNNTLLVFR